MVKTLTQRNANCKVHNPVLSLRTYLWVLPSNGRGVFICSLHHVAAQQDKGKCRRLGVPSGAEISKNTGPGVAFPSSCEASVFERAGKYFRGSL